MQVRLVAAVVGSALFLHERISSAREALGMAIVVAMVTAYLASTYLKVRRTEAENFSKLQANYD